MDDSLMILWRNIDDFDRNNAVKDVFNVLISEALMFSSVQKAYDTSRGGRTNFTSKFYN